MRISDTAECVARALSRDGHGELLRGGAVVGLGWIRVAEMGDGREVRLERVRVNVAGRCQGETRRRAQGVARDLFAMHFMGLVTGYEVCVVAVEEDAPVYVGSDDSGRHVYAVDLLCTEVRAHGRR